MYNYALGRDLVGSEKRDLRQEPQRILGVGVEGLVGDQSAGIDGFDQRFGAGEIVILARAEHHLDRIAEGADQGVNFGGQSATGSADGLRTVFFWAPALCW